jgi:HSP20 family protein
MLQITPWRTHRTALTHPRRDLFQGFYTGFESANPWVAEQEWLPAFDVAETAEEVVVKAELPGVDVKDIDITLTDGLLTIKGEKQKEKEDKQEHYHRVERLYGSFSRSFGLPAGVKADAIDAKYKDGVLTVSLPKAEEVKPKRIEVSS